MKCTLISQQSTQCADKTKTGRLAGVEHRTGLRFFPSSNRHNTW